jgi:hypothetical protein
MEQTRGTTRFVIVSAPAPVNRFTRFSQYGILPMTYGDEIVPKRIRDGG